MKHLLYISVLLMAMVSCIPERCNTPFGQGGTIDLSNPEFDNLYNHVGGTLVVSCGYKGVLVRCVGFSEYVAFECACPHDREVRMEPDDPQAAVILTCPTCGSRFELSYGNPLEGAVTSCPLYQYRTSFDGQNLSIW